MSVVYKGKVFNTDLTKKARGGTEQMRDRLLNNIDANLLKKVAIHFSRPKKLYDDVPNVLYCHDLVDDPAVAMLHTDKDKFAAFVFVSYWQRDSFIRKFNLPYSKCTVIHNAIEEKTRILKKSRKNINFIYHTTPHRGLELAVPVFEKLCEFHDNIHMDVYSSFDVYGWKERDKPYENLFEVIKKHPKMTYHGAVSNHEVLDKLRTSHIFLYPSIWQETSCIALIEAMTCGVLPLYPSLGALPETGSFLSSNLGMYDFHENASVHASRVCEIAHNILQSEKENPGFIERIMGVARTTNNNHEIERFKKLWENLIKRVA